MGLPEKKQHYTYADYCTWDDDERWELIDGEAYAMASPTATHQRILLEFAGQFRDFLRNKPCEVFIAPFDVCLNAAGNDDDDVFQPDLMVICDRAKISEKYCNGAPDMVIEISSPSTAKHDRFRKFNKYQNAGVREYWIVDPDTKTVSTHILKDEGYMIRAYADTDTISVHVLDGCKISLADVFPLDEKKDKEDI